MKAFLSIIILFTLNYSYIKASDKYCLDYCKGVSPAGYHPCLLGCLSQGNCFSKETSISVRKNKSITETNIANIKKGDIVLTIEKGKKIFTTVKNIYKEEGSFIFYYIQAKNEKGNIISLKVTENHGIIILNDHKKTIIHAKNAKNGDLLLAEDGIYIIFNIGKEQLKEKYSLYTENGTILASKIFVSTVCEKDIENGVSFDEFIKKWRIAHNYNN